MDHIPYAVKSLIWRIGIYAIVFVVSRVGLASNIFPPETNAYFAFMIKHEILWFILSVILGFAGEKIGFMIFVIIMIVGYVLHMPFITGNL